MITTIIPSGVVNGVNPVFTFSTGSADTPVIAVYSAGVFQSPGSSYDYALSYSGGGLWSITFTSSSIPVTAPVTVMLFGSGAVSVTDTFDLTTLSYVQSYLNIGNSPTGQPIPVVSVTVASNVLTVVCNPVTASEMPYAGQQVEFANMTSAGFLNGVTVTVLPGVTGTTFTAAFTYANYATTNDVGIVQPLLPASIDTSLLSSLITSISQLFYDLCGRDVTYDADGNVTGGMFSAVTTYTEYADGNGGTRLFPRNAPIQSVTSIQVGSTSIPASTGLTSPGYVIDQSKRFIAIRPGGGGSGTFSNWGAGLAWKFCEGVQNIQLVYSAGYNGVPLDLQEAATKAVALNYMRRTRPDLASENMPSAGTTSYRGFALQPEVWLVVNKYKRMGY